MNHLLVAENKMGSEFSEPIPLSTTGTVPGSGARPGAPTSSSRWRPVQTPQDHHHSSSVPHTTEYYLNCLYGGILSSSIRWIKTPFDSVKVNQQVYPQKFTGFRTGLHILYQQGSLYKGFIPTVFSYSFQSGTKYCLYEVLKDQYSMMLTPEQVNQYRPYVYLAAAGSAEAVADVLMTPWEMLKVKIQTSSPGGNFPTRFGPALMTMIKERHQFGFPFGSLTPLWMRQVPGTMANFLTFEYSVEAIYTYLLTRPKEDYSNYTQLLVTFGAGYVAGFVSTLISHPADSLVSLRAKPEHAGQSLVQIARHVGFYHLATQGLGPRILMTGTIIGYQWLAYDTFKTVMGMGTTGNKH